MKICLIGDYTANLDEGLKNIAHYTARQLSENNTVEIINIKKLMSFKNLRIILKFKPDVIHYLSGPTFSSFVFLKFIGLRWKKSKKIISALHPKAVDHLFTNKLFKSFSGILKPDTIIVQDMKSKSLFESIGYKTKLIINGVDTDQFHPVSMDTRLKLRQKYNIDPKKYVLLHVGHLLRVRNIQTFKDLQKDNCQVVIVGSTYLGKDKDLCGLLEQIGCIIISGYQKEINELYALADCYIFPVEKGNSIFIPLSILEAMSCNLPVIATRYEGLNELFHNVDGLYLEDNIDQFGKLIDEIRKGGVRVNTRNEVSRYSWANITEELLQCYLKA